MLIKAVVGKFPIQDIGAPECKRQWLPQGNPSRTPQLHEAQTCHYRLTASLDGDGA
jgi:hypothetical protein